MNITEDQAHDLQFSYGTILEFCHVKIGFFDLDRKLFIIEQSTNFVVYVEHGEYSLREMIPIECHLDDSISVQFNDGIKPVRFCHTHACVDLLIDIHQMRQRIAAKDYNYPLEW